MLTRDKNGRIRQTIMRYNFLSICYCKYSSNLYHELLGVEEYCDLEIYLLLGLTQDHWKSHHSIDRIRVPIRLYCNCGHILYRFRDKARYWSKIAIFYTPLCNNPWRKIVANILQITCLRVMGLSDSAYATVRREHISYKSSVL